MSNPNTVYANIFVDELIRSGLKHVCFVPGSRHTPLILAFARYKETINIYSHLDERSASFFALGLALALDEPVAMVCTSGTAGANFFPAIIEAHQSRVPLIVLTADRPHELRQSGANQTIDQVKMFGDFVLWFYDAPLPEANPPDVALRNLRTLAARTVAKANGLRKGVVHINMPFRKPLEPFKNELDSINSNQRQSEDTTVPFTRKRFDRFQTHDGTDYDFADDYAKYEKGIIIIGPKCGDDEFFLDKYKRIAKISKYPVLTDPISGGRFLDSESTLLGGQDNFLDALNYQPDIVYRIGSTPISKTINDYLNRINPVAYSYVTGSSVWSDESHLITRFHEISELTFLSFIANYLERHFPDEKHNSQWFKSFELTEKTTWQVIDHEIETGDYFDGAVVYDVVDLIPDGSTLFAGNSLPVRHLDQFGKPTNKQIFAYANRGASGIDGNVSTALGTGAGRPDKPLVAIVGDITFYHDMNGLLAVHRCGVPITIVLLNNDGGGIFHRLPIREHDPAFTDYFITAHGLDFSHSARLYGLDYVRADTRDEFRQAFRESVTNRHSTIIEVRTDAQADLKRRNEIVSAVHARLKELDI